MAEKLSPLDQFKSQLRDNSTKAGLGNINVNPYKGDSNTTARVRRPSTSDIEVNLAADTIFPQTMNHEVEHLLHNSVTKRYNQSYDVTVIKELARVKEAAKNVLVDPLTDAKAELIISLSKAGKSQELRKHLESLGAEPAAYIGGIPDNGFSLGEQWAELHAIEQKLNKDLTKDPVVMKEFFNNDKDIARTYRASVGLRTQRLDSKDLPPMSAVEGTDPPAKPTPVIDAIKSSAQPPSVIDQVLQLFGIKQ